MDYGAFDALTKTLAGEAGPRRAVVRLLTGGALGGLLARLGLDESADAKKKRDKRHDDKKQSGQLHAAGKRHKRHKDNKHKDKKKDKPKPPKDPEPEPECPLDKFPCPDGTCVPWGSCCTGEKRCYEAKRCVPANSCCPEQKPCDGNCIPKNECCFLAQPLCGECKEPFCNNGSWECRATCCVGAPPHCGPCSMASCVEGAWTCEKTMAGEECPASPNTCCPTHLTYPVYFCHVNGACCYQEGGSSTVNCFAN